MTRTKKFIALFMVLLVASFVAGCSGGDDSDASYGGDGGGGDQGATAAREGANYDEDAQASQDEFTAVGASHGSLEDRDMRLPEFGPSVIKTAILDVEVERGSFRDSVQRAINVAEAHGGFILTTEIGSGEDIKRGSLVLRVPAEQFESTLGELKGFVEKVVSESISGQDVTQEFVDLNARLRNYEAQENVLLGLMRKATTINASIRVQRELQQVQLEIEQLRGRLNFLDDQTSYSTITVDMKEAGIVGPKPKGTLAKAWANAKDTFMGVVSAVIIGAGFVVPLALLAAIAALILRLLWPWFQGMNKARTSA